MNVKKCDIKTCGNTIEDILEEPKAIFLGLEYDLCPDCLQKIKDWVKKYLGNGRQVATMTLNPTDQQLYWPQPNGISKSWPGEVIHIPTNKPSETIWKYTDSLDSNTGNGTKM